MADQQKMKCFADCPGDDTCEQNLYCMCGCTMEHHGIGGVHRPISVHSYYSQVTYQIKDIGIKNPD